MCYTIPIAASIVTSSIWMRNRDAGIGQLNLMLYGASLFGVIDHLWNGELFLISGNIGRDLVLGVVITVSVFGAWFLGRVLSRRRAVQKA
jgi:hypothetical protein